MIFYTNSTAEINATSGQTALAYKTAGAETVNVTAVNGKFTFATGNKPGMYHYQIADASGKIAASGTFEIRQDLAHASADFDPRSDAVKTLEALDAKIAGRALTIQQSKITVGDRSIEYMNSIDELLKWRDHFARIVALEQGHGTPTAQVCFLRRR